MILIMSAAMIIGLISGGIDIIDKIGHWIGWW